MADAIVIGGGGSSTCTFLKGNDADKPATGKLGQLYYATDLNICYF